MPYTTPKGSLLAPPASPRDADDTSSILTDIISLSPAGSDDQIVPDAVDPRIGYGRSEYNEAAIQPGKHVASRGEEEARPADDLLAQIGVLRGSAQAARSRRHRFRDGAESVNQASGGEASIHDLPEPISETSYVLLDGSKREPELSSGTDDDIASTNPGCNNQEHTDYREHSSAQYLSSPAAVLGHNPLPLQEERVRDKRGKRFGGFKAFLGRLFCFIPSLAAVEMVQLPRFPPAQFDTQMLRANSTVPISSSSYHAFRPSTMSSRSPQVLEIY